MITSFQFTDEEKEQANICVNVNRIIRVLDDVWDYAAEKKDKELLNIIQDYLNLKEL